ncbi:P-loop containing nucleoside triphosphate hydrolase [Sesbania bispinosa]|nr:P-loop containing nucleoside triphosphate hydrolase [Sesbania bispinosa]
MRQKINNSESGFLGSISSSSIRYLLPRSSTRKPTSSSPKSNTENTPPTHPNIPINHHHQSQPNTPFSHNDPPVVVRIRPENSNGKGGDWTIKKVSSDALCVGDRQFTFDEVFDTDSNQEDVFQSVGVPLVRNALAGYNTSILSYGQSGSGKTYTMWGPPSAMVEEPLCHSDQGIIPRIFQMLFSELERIYNEQIGNLLNPTQHNLEMKDDVNNALHIENLVEEYVTSYDDMEQILIKGLSSRKLGATSLNSNSSRSHIIFTFVIESFCKGTTKGFSSSKVSRISLIDLAGLDGDKVDDGDNQCLRESTHVKKSLSQLGHLVDVLTGKSQSEKDQDISHSNSYLTRLLQDSLGGNAKLSVICSISPDNKSNGETLRTLRFGERVRSIRNEPVINVIKEADVDLSDKIRHLKVYSVEESCDADTTTGDEIEKAEVCYRKTSSKPCHEDIVASADNLVCTTNPSRAIKSTFRDSISVSSCSQSPILHGPQLSESPKFQRKSITMSSSYLGSWNSKAESSNFSKDVLGKAFKRGEHMRSSLQSSKADSLAASLQRGLQIIDYHQQNSELNKSSTSFSFQHLTLTPCPEIDNVDSCDQTIQQKPSNDEVTTTFLCASCQTKISNQDSTQGQYSLKSGTFDGLTDKIPNHLENVMAKGIMREELENVCKEQAARIEQLNQLVEKLKGEKELNSIAVYRQREEYNPMENEDMPLRGTSSNGHLPYIIEEKCEIKEVQEELTQRDISLDSTEKESLLEEIRSPRSKLQLYSDAPVKMSTDKLRYSLMSRSIQLQKSGVFSHDNRNEELENERQRWTEMESEWICLTDELRDDLESYRQRAEKLETELKLEKKCTEEMDDALNRAVIGHARMVEHYTDLQEKYDDLVAKHDAIMEGIAEVKKAAAKASKKGHARFANSLSAELSALRVERERESKLLKKENQILKIQLRDTAEAVQAAGELLVRLREAEHAASVAEAWRAEFGATYQEHY